jgi:hypothetical protein
MPPESGRLGERIAPWTLAIALAAALYLAYRTNPLEDLHLGIVHHDAIPPCRTNLIQIFDAPVPTVTPDLCWAHLGDRIIWTFPNHADRPFHVHMSPHPFAEGPAPPFEADSEKGVVVSQPVRVSSDYVIYKYLITYDGGKKRLDPHILIMR